MSSTQPEGTLKNIILVGPGGSIGSVLLESLLSEPAFTVSVLVRESSKSINSLPSEIHKVIKIADDYPYAKIVEAFRGQDAVVNAITSAQVAQQFRIIDAAVEAGVKRYIPSEYGLNYQNAEARALNSVFGGKGKVQDYLIEKEETGLTWHSINCGMWIDWCLKNNFLGVNYSDKTMTFADDGQGKFSTSTTANTALALDRALLAPAKSSNKSVYISDFALSQAELLELIEKISGEKWTTKSIDSTKVIDEAKLKAKEGDHVALWQLVDLGFSTGRYGAHLEEKEVLWNETLGLPNMSKEDVVRAALEKKK